MNRPKGLAATTALMALCNASNWVIIDYRSPHALRAFVICTIVILIGYWVLWYYFKGKNWARIIVLLDSILAIFSLRYWNPRSGSLLTTPTRVNLLAELALATFLLIWLNTRTVRSFFKGQAA